ncbi:glycosyltransferase family 4 protein [Magnetococcus sp. PR-3]|uniref:glycosyltransferase family 4 protein n=1 Tax=Magnetococcus sp. PR-3 TaxID=3120355 RepID=UPI002FCE3929
MSQTGGAGSSKQPRILVVYDYFSPAFRAGGPVVSLANLVRFLADKAQVSVFARNRDLDGSVLPVESDRWLAWPDGGQVLYAQQRWSFVGLWRAIRERQPDIIYINGVFSPVVSLMPLLVQPWVAPQSQLILAPRGMLQKQALAVKALKKRLYLSLLLFPLLRRRSVQIHVTGPEEAADLPLRIRANLATVPTQLGNLPRLNLPFRGVHLLGKPPSLVTMALISPMKNILPVLHALAHVEAPLHYHLYGPIKDRAYWQQCQQAAQNLPAHIQFTYHGALPHAQVPEVLARYDVAVQPSRSENFGHALFEAMMLGLPLLTSRHTPWNGLNEQGAGWNVPGEDVKALTEVLSAITHLEQSTFERMSRQARQVAQHYVEQQGLQQGYSDLFQLEPVT